MDGTYLEGIAFRFRENIQGIFRGNLGDNQGTFR
jgi:hypothetical protein